jgi:hypothetical protein
VNEHEVDVLLRRIRALALEIAELERGAGAGQLEEKRRTLEQLRWRLTGAVRGTTEDNFDAAA